jgi:hypothetical protein
MNQPSKIKPISCLLNRKKKPNQPAPAIQMWQTRCFFALFEVDCAIRFDSIPPIWCVLLQKKVKREKKPNWKQSGLGEAPQPEGKEKVFQSTDKAASQPSPDQMHGGPFSFQIQPSSSPVQRKGREEEKKELWFGVVVTHFGRKLQPQRWSMRRQSTNECASLCAAATNVAIHVLLMLLSVVAAPSSALLLLAAIVVATESLVASVLAVLVPLASCLVASCSA